MVAVVVMAGVGGLAHGAQVVQLPPNIPVGAAHVYLNIFLINDDTGAIYNSAALDAAWLGGLADVLYALPVNFHTFDSPKVMMQEWALGVTPDGNVYNGWSAALSVDGASRGAVALTNIGGRPGDYDQWRSTSGSNTMALTLMIPLRQLERDGTIGYAASRDAQLVLTAAPLQQAFVGVHDIDNMFSAPAYRYGLVWAPVDCASANVSGSGTVGLADLAQVAGMWLETGLFLPEDITKDGRVDLADLTELARWWGVECEL